MTNQLQHIWRIEPEIKGDSLCLTSTHETSSGTYRGAALICSAHRVLLCAAIVAATERHTKEEFMELSFYEEVIVATPPDEPIPELPRPEPAIAPTPDPVEKKQPTPRVIPPTNNKEATPTDEPPQSATPAAEGSIDGGAGGPGITGDNPEQPSGNQGNGIGPGKRLDAKSMLPLYSVGGIVDAAGKKPSDVKKAFVRENAGGFLAPVSTINAGNTRPLGKAKKVFVGYLHKMHERIHKHWLKSIQGYESSECTAAINDINLEVTLEIVLDAKGGLERAAPIETSGQMEFDAAAVGAVFDAAPFPAPPSFIQSYDGKVYVHWVFHRDNRHCGIQYARAFVLTNPKTDGPTSEPIVKEYTPEEEALLADAEEAFPTLPESKGFRKEFVSAVSKMGESCKQKLKMLRDTIREEGLIRGVLMEKLKAYIPDGFQEDDAVTFIKSFKTKEFCKGTPAYVFSAEIPKGPPDEISFPGGQCDPSCREICFTF
jgi:TonB family protein